MVSLQHGAAMLMQPLELLSKNYPTTIKNVSLVGRVTTFTPTQINVHVAFVTLHSGAKPIAPKQWLAKYTKWRKEEYRHAYMESTIEQGIAWQIRINRERRQMSQRDLASKIGSRQSAISRAEDTSYGRHRLETLVKIANAFDCALQVKLIPYSSLARDSEDLSLSALYAPSYSEETIHANQTAKELTSGIKHTT
jgi:transcriptional regulator with XRE-family HTH domain